MFKRKRDTASNDIKIKSTLAQPQRHYGISENAQWLSGEGAGSWFDISLIDNNYQITRYSPDGDVECKSLFKTKEGFDIDQPFEFIHLSHCSEVNVLQQEKQYKFERSE